MLKNMTDKEKLESIIKKLEFELEVVRNEMKECFNTIERIKSSVDSDDLSKQNMIQVLLDRIERFKNKESNLVTDINKLK